MSVSLVRAARAALLLGLAACVACGRSEPPSGAPAPRPSILLITLDTTRADSIGPDASAVVDTPAFTALAARGLRFRQAYATVPETLPSHSSMMTGLYPAGHGIHENARVLSGDHPVIAQQLQQAGYRTAAFVSSFVLAKRFGLARGFDLYDDVPPEGRAERTAVETTERVLAHLARGAGAGGGASATGPATASQPSFMWVHYFDPHAPYTPPAPFDRRYAQKPYLGEVAAMDEQIGRLAQAFEQQAKGPVAIAIVGDHGEGLGDHGEAQHGNLVYQSTMHVPLVLVGPGIQSGTSDVPVSTRRIFHTLLDWAGIAKDHSLRETPPTPAAQSAQSAQPAPAAHDVVLGEGMKPFLEYGWQPQVMAIEGRQKAIYTGKTEVYDLLADPAEARDLSDGAQLSAALQKALDEYPVPSPDAARASNALTDEARRSLATLGYVSASVPPVIRKGAPRPEDMVPLFDVIDRASTLFVQERYAQVIPLLKRILAKDPENLAATLRLATAHSALGQDALAVAAFTRAGQMAPSSSDVRTYLGLHYARGKEWPRADPLLEAVVRESPDRLPAVEALAAIREKQGRLGEAVSLRKQAYALRTPTAQELARLGQLAMEGQQTATAIESFERARALQGGAFAHDLELGVLYLAERRFGEARTALDRVPSTHPDFAMTLFKRAQVSVLLNEADAGARIARARQGADATTRALIAGERLFQGR